METYLAGIDIGTSGAKGMIFDLKATRWARVTGNIPAPTQGRAGWNRTPTCLWNPRCRLWEAGPGERRAGRRIVSLSFSAQRCCGIFLDGSERQVRPMISWQDNRSTAEVKEIASRIDEAELYRLTGYPNSTTWLLSKMMWVRHNEPEVWKQTRRVVQMHDYFVRALGGTDYVVDWNDAGFFGFFDSEAGCWHPRLLDLFDIPLSMLPVPQPSGMPVARISPETSARIGLPK